MHYLMVPPMKIIHHTVSKLPLTFDTGSIHIPYHYYIYNNSWNLPISTL